MKLRGWWLLGVLLVGMDYGITAQDDYDTDDLVPDKATMIQTYIRIATSIAYKGYRFFTKGQESYDLQLDVLDHPYKKMVYVSCQAIEKLFDDANRHDNPLVQTQAIILLCRMPISEWYLKSFYKGLDVLYPLCFDDHGNFVDASGVHDIRSIFKDYCRKSPASWQEIAEISDWWCKNKKPHAMYTKYYPLTCTDHNEELLEMAHVDDIEQLVYLQYLLQKNGSPAARKLYDHQIAQFLKSGMQESDARK